MNSEAEGNMILTVLIIFWIAGTLVTNFVALEKGRSPGWAGIAFFFSPLLALLALCALPNLPKKIV
jgi:hypothetical protein